MIVTREFTLGDRLISLTAKLWRPDGAPVVLGAAETVAFRMVLASDGTVKVDDQAAVIVSRGVAATTPAEVRYDWAAADVDTAGVYAGFFVRQSAGETEHFPTQDYSAPEFKIVFKPKGA